MTKAVEEARALLRRLDDANVPAERDRLAEALMRTIYRLGLALHRGEEPPASADEIATTFAPVLRRIAGALAHVVGSIESLFVFGLDEWDEVAWRRSALEFLLMILARSDADWLREQIEPEAYDDLIRRYSHDFGYLRPSEIPPGTPTSHWWWWAPQEPDEYAGNAGFPSQG